MRVQLELGDTASQAPIVRREAAMNGVAERRSQQGNFDYIRVSLGFSGREGLRETAHEHTGSEMSDGVYHLLV